MQEVADALRLDTELSADSAAYIEELYEQYLTSQPPSLRTGANISINIQRVTNHTALCVSNSYY